MPGKLFIKTHGCQMNEYDSAKMADVLKAAHGLDLTQNEAEADVILINTCSIRERAGITFEISTSDARSASSPCTSPASW